MFSLFNWLRRLFYRTHVAYRRKPIVRPRHRLDFDCLENRLTPSTMTFINSMGGMWSDPSNWNSGTVPGVNDDPTIPFSGISVNSMGSIAVHSLHSAANLMVNGSLTLADASNISGNLNVQQGGLYLPSGAVLTATGGGMVMGNVQLAANSELVVNGGMFNVSGGMGRSNVILAAGSELLVSAGMFGIGNGNLTNRGGTVELDAGSFTFMGGTFTNPGGTVAVNGGAFTLMGGTFTDGGGTVKVAGGVFAVSVMASFIQNNPADNLVIGPAGEMDLGGTVNLTAGSSQIAGNFQQTAGIITASTSFQIAVGGQANLIGGVFNMLDGFSAQGPGPINVANGQIVTLNGAVNIASLNLTGGIFDGTGTINIRDSWTWTGGIVIGQNQLNPLQIVVGNNAAVAISGQAGKTLIETAVTLGSGSTTDLNGGPLNVIAGKISNQGTFFVRGPNQDMVVSGTGDFINSGAVRFLMGDGYVCQFALDFTNSGTVLVNTGIVSFSGVVLQPLELGGNYVVQIQGGAVVRVLNSMAIFSGQVTGDGLLQVGDGFQSAFMRLRTPPNIRFVGGGTLLIDKFSSLSIQSGGTIDLIGFQLTNYGTVAFHDFSRMGLSNGASIWNQPGASILVDGMCGITGTGLGTESFNNFGLLEQLPGAIPSSTTISGCTINNQNAPNSPVGAEVQVDSGTMVFAGSGVGSAEFNVAAGAILDFSPDGLFGFANPTTYTLQAGAVFTGDGVVGVLNGATLKIVEGAVVECDPELDIGNDGAPNFPNTFFPGVISVPGLVTNNLVTWLDGSLINSLQFTNMNTLNIFIDLAGNAVDPGVPALLRSSVLVNRGHVHWAGPQNIELNIQGANGSDSQIVNYGIFDIQGEAQMRYPPGSTADGFINAAGAWFEKLNGNALFSTVIQAAFLNKGQVTMTGQNINFLGGFKQQQGTVWLSNNAAMRAPSLRIAGGWVDLGAVGGSWLIVPGGLTIGPNGGLAGIGTVVGPVTNLGLISPGSFAAPQGVLTINGDFTQADGGTLQLRLPSMVGGLNDSLLIVGAANLGGILSITTAGINPAPGSQFIFITDFVAPWNGDFAAYSLPLGFGGLPIFAWAWFYIQF